MSGFVIKVLAAATMLTDHIGFFLLRDDLYGDIPLYMRALGRVSFFLFAFLIAEGCSHTKDIKKYLLRLTLFAFISEIPYDLFITLGTNEPVDWFYIARQNVFFTWAAAVLSVIIYKEALKQKKKARKVILLLSVSFIAIGTELLNTDYGAIGVLLVLLLYTLNGKQFHLYKIQAAVYTAVFAFLLYGTFTSINAALLGAFLSLPVILKYNGEKGAYNSKLKYWFYIFYPAHMLILYAIFGGLGSFIVF